MSGQVYGGRLGPYRIMPLGGFSPLRTLTHFLLPQSPITNHRYIAYTDIAVANFCIAVLAAALFPFRLCASRPSGQRPPRPTLMPRRYDCTRPTQRRPPPHLKWGEPCTPRNARPLLGYRHLPRPYPIYGT